MTDITLEQRARELAEKLRAIHDDPLYQAVWASAHNHGINYANGPKYDKELEALEAALRLSAGADWVLVPREPTAHMVNRAHDATDPDCNATCGEIVEIYRAMLAAAPRHEPGEG